MEWIPCWDYNALQTVNPSTQVDLPLMDITPMATAAEVEGRIEYKENYRIVRIVGQFNLNWGGEQIGTGAVSLRCWPGFVDLETATPVVPGLIGPMLGAGNTAQVANERWWWERKYGPQALGATGSGGFYFFLDVVNHPWWSVIDIRPGAFMGDSDIPVMSIANGDQNETVNFTHWIRMLVK